MKSNLKKIVFMALIMGGAALVVPTYAADAAAFNPAVMNPRELNPEPVAAPAPLGWRAWAWQKTGSAVKGVRSICSRTRSATQGLPKVVVAVATGTKVVEADPVVAPVVAPAAVAVVAPLVVARAAVPVVAPASSFWTRRSFWAKVCAAAALLGGAYVVYNKYFSQKSAQ